MRGRCAPLCYHRLQCDAKNAMRRTRTSQPFSKGRVHVCHLLLSALWVRAGPDGNRRRAGGAVDSGETIIVSLAGQPSKRLLPCGAFAVAKGQSLSVAAQCPQSFMLSRGAARWGFLTPGRCARHQLLGSPVPCLKALARGGKRRILWLAQAMTPLEPLATLACPLALPLLPLQPRILATRVAGPPTPPLPPPPPLACFY
jgi:hypothetical protein